MEPIADMQNYVRSRQRKGKTPQQVIDDLVARGDYDEYAAYAFVIMHWEIKDKDLVVYSDERE